MRQGSDMVPPGVRSSPTADCGARSVLRGPDPMPHIHVRVMHGGPVTPDPESINLRDLMAGRDSALRIVRGPVGKAMTIIDGEQRIQASIMVAAPPAGAVAGIQGSRPSACLGSVHWIHQRHLGGGCPPPGAYRSTWEERNAVPLRFSSPPRRGSHCGRPGFDMNRRARPCWLDAAA